jgi:hypothetical protein
VKLVEHGSGWTGRRLVDCLAATLLVGLVAAPGAAQSGPDPADSAAIQLGALALTPTLGLSFGRDDNVFNSPDEPESDFMATLEPEVDLWLRMGRARMSAQEQLSLIYFDRFENQRAVNSTTSGRFELVGNRLTPYVTARYLNVKERPGAEIDIRARRRELLGSAGMNVRITGKARLDVSLEQSRVSFEDDAFFRGVELREELDRTRRRLGVTLDYSLTPLTNIFVSAGSYEDSFGPGSARDSTSYRVGPGVQFQPLARVSGRAEIGVLRFVPNAPSVKTFTGLDGVADLTYVLRGATRFTVTATRGVTYSLDEFQSYFVQTRVAGSVTHRISERWDLQGNAGRERLAYPAALDPLAPTGATARTDTARQYGVSVGFYFNRGLRLGLGLDYSGRTSEFERGRYDRLMLLTSVSYGYR